MEASLRRLSHYDFWTDKVRKPIILDAKADLLVYGMGERQSLEIVKRLDGGESIQDMVDIQGTVYATSRAKFQELLFNTIEIPSFEEVGDRDKQSNTPTESGKLAYAQAFQIQLMQQNPIRGKRIIQACMDRLVVQNPPALPLDEAQFDRLYELPFTLDAHPDYENEGGVPALKEVQFSLTSNRGCFGSCSFCAITNHQGRMIQTRSKASLVKEAERMTAHRAFKGYIHGPGRADANFQGLACDQQLEKRPLPCQRVPLAEAVQQPKGFTMAVIWTCWRPMKR